jgi:hypothetical protein
VILSKNASWVLFPEELEEVVVEAECLVVLHAVNNRATQQKIKRFFSLIRGILGISCAKIINTCQRTEGMGEMKD